MNNTTVTPCRETSNNRSNAYSEAGSPEAPTCVEGWFVGSWKQYAKKTVHAAHATIDYNNNRYHIINSNYCDYWCNILTIIDTVLLVITIMLYWCSNNCYHYCYLLIIIHSIMLLSTIIFTIEIMIHILITIDSSSTTTKKNYNYYCNNTNYLIPLLQ